MSRETVIQIDLVKEKITVFLLAFYVFVFLSGNLLPINLSALSLLTGIFFLGISIKHKKVLLGAINLGQIGVYTFLFYGAITVLWSNAPVYGARKVILIFLFVFLMTYSKAYISRSSKLFIRYFSFLFASFLFIYLFSNGLAVFEISSIYARFNLTGDQNPIVVAYFLSAGIIILFLYLESHKPSILFTLAVFVSMIFAFALDILTGSKGPLMGMIVSFVLFFLLKLRLSFKAFIKIIAGVLFLVLAATIIISRVEFSPIIYDFIEARFLGDSEASSSFSSRTELYELTVNEFAKANPFCIIFGNGSGSFGYLFTGKDEMMYPHNIFLEILYEYGFIGLFLFAAILFRVIFLNITTDLGLPSKLFFLLFYFALAVSFVSRDLTGNCLIFVCYIFIEELQQTKFRITKSIII